MKDKIIILDLDDTLISTHLRQYNCINDYLTSKGIKFIDYNSYYDLRRRNHYSNTALLENLSIDLNKEEFNAFYLDNIESEKYLAFDTLIADQELLASTILKDFELVLLSLRNNHVNSARQIRNLGIDVYFKELFFVHHTEELYPKLYRLNELKAEYDVVAFCSDAVKDYESANLLNINFVQVKTALYDLPDFQHANQFNNINDYFLSIP